MCGIAGIYNSDFKLVERDVLRSLTDFMEKRGPDDSGFFLSGHLGLGFRRLSIIDLVGGHQPLSNEDKSVHLIFNGEIYNYKELREELLAKGHNFSTNGDAEVLVHLYEEYGVLALEKLNGMFAFALYDSFSDELLIARDRLGIKPLFYKVIGKTFVFASDSFSISRVFPSKISNQSALDYLGFAYVTDESSIWDGIHKLKPGHFLRIKDGSDAEIKCYWSIPAIKNWQGSFLMAQKELDYLLRDSIDLELRSDVPVGLFLSGGADSTALLAYASDISSSSLSTFTVNFSEKNSLDAFFSKHVAKIYGSNHFQIDYDLNQFENDFERFIPNMDEPISDSAIFPAYFLSEYAKKKGISVLLNGAGGDEIFGGYRRHFPPRFGSPTWVAELTKGKINQFISAGIGCINSSGGWRAQNPAYSWVAGISGANLSLLSKIVRDANIFNDMLIRLVNKFGEVTHNTDPANYSYSRMLYDVKTYLPENILALTDKATMAASVECRVPMLDHRLVEFAFSLPSDINLKNGISKSLFKSVISDLVPKEILARKKEGFNVSLEQQLISKNFDKYFDKVHPIVNELIDIKKLAYLNSSGGMRSIDYETVFSIALLNLWAISHV